MNVCIYMWIKVPVDARGTRSLKSGVLGSCELPSLCARGQNPDSLQDQYVLFTLNSSYLLCKYWEIVLLAQMVTGMLLSIVSI